MSKFTGFPRAGLESLTTLGEKDKTWFDKHRGTYDADVVTPAKAFVAAMGEALAARISPAIAAQPKTNGSIAPINNDLRFNPDASPYKKVPRRISSSHRTWAVTPSRIWTSMAPKSRGSLSSEW